MPYVNRADGYAVEGAYSNCSSYVIELFSLKVQTILASQDGMVYEQRSKECW